LPNSSHKETVLIFAGACIFIGFAACRRVSGYAPGVNRVCGTGVKKERSSSGEVPMEFWCTMTASRWDGASMARGKELPRIDNSRKYRGLAPENEKKPLWRITCFAVIKKYRRRGVASAALQAALRSIKQKGGGLVEAFPSAIGSLAPSVMSRRMARSQCSREQGSK